MYKQIKRNDNIAYDVNEYAIDSEEDLEEIPESCGMGSIAIVISTSKVFMKNSFGEWVEL